MTSAVDTLVAALFALFVVLAFAFFKLAEDAAEARRRAEQRHRVVLERLWAIEAWRRPLTDELGALRVLVSKRVPPAPVPPLHPPEGPPTSERKPHTEVGLGPDRRHKS